MRRPVILALTACLALTGYVALQPEASDELARPADRGASPGSPAAPAVPASSAPSQRLASASRSLGEPARRQALAQALADWQARRQSPELLAADPLTRQAWGPPQPAPPPVRLVAAESSSPPEAPVFPHGWVGRYLDPAPRAIIAGPMRTWVVSTGDVIEGQWRVDAIDERQMTLTYLPLGLSQTVAMK